MALRKLNARVKIRRKKASEFTKENPVLLAGELAVEQDTNKVKVGDGTTAWNNLKYLVDMDSIKQLIEEVKVSAAYSIAVPLGTVMYYPKSTIPSPWNNTWRICNGASIAKSVYPELFSAMGWSDSTHALPNLIDNRFIEGSTSTWQYKNAGLPNIKGGFPVDENQLYRPDIGWEGEEVHCIKPFGCFTSDNIRYWRGASWNTDTENADAADLLFDASISCNYSINGRTVTSTNYTTIYSDSVNTVQPKSMTLLPIIRVK